MNALELAQKARAAARSLSIATTEQKNAALGAMAFELRAARHHIVTANGADLAHAKQTGTTDAFLDRLKLDDDRIEWMARAIESVAALPDPIGEITDAWDRPNGLKVKKVRLPLGVVLMIYEARPNVTSDAAGLCLKSGNAVILRGGSEALATNTQIANALSAGLKKVGLSPDCVQLVTSTDRNLLLELIKLEGKIDLCIPRGGEGLIRFIAENARVPLVKHYQGVCHVYVHSDADLEQAEKIVVNAKTSRPGVCNAAECLLVDAAIAEKALPKLGRALVEKHVELRACSRSLPILQNAKVDSLSAAPGDFGREFLELKMAVRVVDGLDGAISHIAQYGSEHTEAVLTKSKDVAARFQREVVASAVVVNASTRFNDGGELGLGAEIGISTSRLHAFGPMGLKELTAQKYVVEGSGQVR